MSLTVYNLPTISVSSATICAGQTYSIVPTGATSYTYSSGSNTVSPLSTTQYSVSGTSSLGCTSAAPATLAVTVNSVPVISVNNGTICNGQSFTLTPSGANNYTYSGGNSVVSPTSSAVYTITGAAANGCISSPIQASVTVNPLPILSLNNGSICTGQSFTISTNGASTYTFLNGGSVVTPSITTSYSVAGTSSLGCNGQAVTTITVNTLPTISAPNATICAGATTTLTASGAGTYTWSTSSNASSIVITPSANTTYTVAGTSTAGCVGSAITVSVSVGAAPGIAVSSSTICAGQQFQRCSYTGNQYRLFSKRQPEWMRDNGQQHLFCNR
jgi:hypothetical protein